MIFEERIVIKAPANDIYALYVDVDNWNQWDEEVKDSYLTGVFEMGASGTITPKNGPKSRIQLTQVVPNQSFIVTSKLPFCLLSFEHELIVKGDITEVIHKVTFSGLTSFLFGKLVGSQIHKGLPLTLQGLKIRAEGNV
ncbi:SRPBCC family protein [Shewanella sp. VB17]|uniref:SRPBCC family protein n=1 Tax=Shewanella sp. VB17 TaxID=2739432 RepID=UPI0015655C24|nr:SRPBCC family protein [Shewanella sp. VB17]NRD73449.1 SRPBCC family protein [Shewanella sp. VB17]